MTTMHLWILSCRLRAEGPSGKALSAALLQVFWNDAELKLYEAGVKQKLDKHLTELFESVYGQLMAYDEGLTFGDAYLSSAIVRYH